MNHKAKIIIVGVLGVLFIGSMVSLNKKPSLGAFVESAATFKLSKQSSIESAGEVSTEFSKDEPKVTLKKWNGEIALNIKYKENGKLGKATKNQEKIEWKSAKQELHAYELPAGVGMEDGGVEIEVVLNEKPTTNVFCYEITTNQNLNWYKQLPLWQEQGLLVPTATCTDTDCDTDGDGEFDSFRPLNVVNSFAVYYGKSNHKIGSLNYATGKAFHRYRIQATDADGNQVWGDTTYNSGELCDIISTDWLETAKYPVKL